MIFIESNRAILNNIYNQYPNSVNELRLEGGYLIYGKESVDISEFDLNYLLTNSPEFASGLGSLSSEDVFRIIRLHSMILGSKGLKQDDNKKKAEDKLEIIKQENPLMRNITVVTRPNGVGIDEFFNITDSKGENHLYKNDVNVDIFTIYERLKAMKGNDVTPDELIAEIDRKLYEIRLTQVEDMGPDKVSEDFENKMNRVNDPYKTSFSHNVMGNEENDIAIVADLRDSGSNQIKTFDNDQGDLVINSHGQNVNETVTSAVQGAESTVVADETTVSQDKESDKQVKENKEEEQRIQLIPFEDFKKLYAINNTGDFTEEERKQVDLYYAFLGDLILYEDYLVPELKQILAQLRQFITELEINLEDISQATKRQTEIINKRRELENKTKEKEISTDLDKEQEYVKKLMYQKPNDSGSVATVQVITMILIVAILLVVIAMALISA